MYRLDNELIGQWHYRELLQEAERERLASEASHATQQSFYRSAIYLLGSSMVQFGQRLESAGTSRTIHPSPSATIRES
jgi:hypothetical protein